MLQKSHKPIILAVNKIDVEGANVEKVKEELTKYELVAEEWGGDTIFVPISALTGMGVDELLEMVVLVSQLKEYKANPNRLGVGTVIEAKLDKGRGPVATLLVQNGTVKIGDIIVVGNTFGKIRAMQDEKGKQLTSAGPSKPVEITGITDVPCAGDKFMILDDERKAREISETRTRNRFNEEMGVGKGVSLNDLLKNQSSEELKNLNLIIKCDVQGSIEAIKGLLEKINIDGIIDSHYIESFLEDGRIKFFKRVGSTEKPDILCSKLLEGRIAIFVDGSPIVLTLPFILFEDLQSSQDYFTIPAMATRVLCYVFKKMNALFAISLFLDIRCKCFIYECVKVFTFKTLFALYIFSNTNQGYAFEPRYHRF